MLKTSFTAKLLVLAAAALLLVPDVSLAQRRGGRGGGRGGWGGGYGGWGGGYGGWGGGYSGWGGGYSGWGGYGHGYGWGDGWGIGIGRDGRGYGDGYYGGYSYPYYGSGYYSTPYYGSDYYGSGYYSTPGMYQSAYPPDYSQGNGQMDQNTAMIEVRCPPGAELYFNGKKTQQTGAVRYFTTPALTQGKTYTYEVRMAMPGDGANVGKTREVFVQPGQRTTVDFTTTQQPGGPGSTRQPGSALDPTGTPGSQGQPGSINPGGGIQDPRNNPGGDR